MNLLFICNQNQHRSKTAEMIFKEEYSVRSRGLYNNEVTSADLGWADIVFVMEENQRKEISLRFPKEYLRKRILCLDIPDIYQYGDDRLIALLEEKVNDLLFEKI